MVSSSNQDFWKKALTGAGVTAENADELARSFAESKVDGIDISSYKPDDFDLIKKGIPIGVQKALPRICANLLKPTIVLVDKSGCPLKGSITLRVSEIDSDLKDTVEEQLKKQNILWYDPNIAVNHVRILHGNQLGAQTKSMTISNPKDSTYSVEIVISGYSPRQ